MTRDTTTKCECNFKMSVTLHKNDLPADVKFGDILAVDSETLGLNFQRDRLCLIQLTDGGGDVHVVQIGRTPNAPVLSKLLADPAKLKIFHYARFDMGIMKKSLGVDIGPVYCSRTASKLARTYTDKHGLRDVTRELLGIEINKQQQASDWGADTLTDDQIAYAAADVIHLHKIRDRLDAMLTREGRKELAYRCFEFLPVRVALDLAGWQGTDIFEH